MNEPQRSLLDGFKLHYERLPGDDYILRRIRNWKARMKRKKEKKAHGLCRDKS